MTRTFWTPKRLRILFTVLSLYAIVITLIRFYSTTVVNVQSNDECIWRLVVINGVQRIQIQDIIPDGVADKAGLRYGDILMAIDSIPLKGVQQAQQLINKIPSGGYAVYSIERDGKTMTLPVMIFKFFNLVSVAFILLGLSFVVISYVVGMTKPAEKVTTLFYFTGFGAALFFSPLIETGSGGIFRLINVMIGATLFNPIFIRFCFFFPIEQSFVKRYPVRALYPYALVMVLNVLLLVQIFAGVLIWDQLWILYFLGLPLGFFYFLRGYRLTKSPDDRRGLRVIIWGICAGIMAVGFLLTIVSFYPASILMSPLFMTPVIGVVAIPLSFAYSIFRYRLMDVTIVIKKSLLYAIVTAAIAAVYFTLVIGVGHLIMMVLHVEGGNIMTVTAIVIIAFIFDPLKQQIQEFVNRRFFRDQYHYQKTLLAFSQELPRKINGDEILTLLVDRISSTMHIDMIALCLYESETDVCEVKVHQGIRAECCTFRLAPGGLVQSLRTLRSPQLHYRLKEENTLNLPDEERQRLLQAGIVLTIPMMVQERLVGILHLGAKKSGRPYGEEDLNLLEVVANQAAIALENARLHREDARRQLVEEELSIARRIQEGLLPAKSPKIPGLDISGVMIPARTVGGDYFDFIQLDPHRLIVVVGDVSGKGMSAALYMSKIQGMIQLASRIYSSPKDILVEVNRRIYESISRRSFITMVIALFDMKKRRVRICRAGHPQPLGTLRGKHLLIKTKGIGLGLEKGRVFEKELQELSKPLTRGSTYLLYSDGITEAMNDRREEYGDERVVKIFDRTAARPATDIQHSLLRDVEKFRGTAEQNDDITVVAVKIV
jgi:phosphoserine phosphatase RsbU/P